MDSLRPRIVAPCYVELEQALKALQPEQIAQIDDALADVGPDDEIRLIGEHFRLFRIKKLKSEVISIELDAA